MVICFECTKETKAALDGLLALGEYKDYSEILAVAIGNQALLHSKIGESRVLQVEGKSLREPLDDGAATTAPRRVNLALVPEVDLTRYGIPDLFAPMPSAPGSKHAGAIAAYRARTLPPGGVFRLSEWIFGQYNRLLPIKATCRALARLTTGPEGANVNQAARRIAEAANDLGLHLKMLDRRHQRSRDEMLATAFPSTSEPEKGKLRYASQFVASISKTGFVSGLPSDLQLLGLAGKDSIALTEAGWTFAHLPNPILDGREENPHARFSDQERQFLLAHIKKHVPAEYFAYSAVLNAIAAGGNTPDLLAKALKELEAPKGKISDPFYATQRSGAISRMTDLDLISRDREGIRVRYVVTPTGKEFLSQIPSLT